MKKTRSVKNGMMLWTDSYLADTGHLTCLEHGAYLLILMAMWRSPTGWISSDRIMLSRTAKLTADKWRHVEASVCPLLVQSDDGSKVSQKRLLEERQIALCKSEKRSLAAKGCKAPKPLINNDVGSDFVGVLLEPPNPNPILGKKESKLVGESIQNGKGGVGGGEKSDVLATLLSVLDRAHAEAIVAHRQKKRSPLTPLAARLLVKQFAKCPDPNAAAEEMLLRGWQSFKAEWAPDIIRKQSFPIAR